MSLGGPVWHSVRGLGTVLAAAALVPACYGMHGRSGDAGVDARIDSRDVASPDGGSAPDVVLPDLDAGRDRCGELLAELRGGTPATDIGCDGRTFPRDCSAPLGDCCVLILSCAIAPSDGGHVEVSIACDDSCAQGCAVQTAADCELFPECDWFNPGACGPGPETSIQGPACINQRSGPCMTDADCAAGQRCRSYWIDPCAGLGCGACGGEELACSY